MLTVLLESPTTFLHALILSITFFHVTNTANLRYVTFGSSYGGPYDDVTYALQPY